MRLLQFLVSRWRAASAGLVLFLCGAFSAQAHPGHGLESADLKHLLTSPYHVAILSLLGGGLWFGARSATSPAVRKALRAGGAALIMTAVMLWGAAA